MSLLKIAGQVVVTEEEQRTRLVWVDDPVTPPITPPVTPPVTPPPTPPTTPGIYVPFTGGTFIPCVNAAGQHGTMMVTINADGSMTRRSECIISEGLS